MHNALMFVTMVSPSSKSRPSRNSWNSKGLQGFGVVAGQPPRFIGSVSMVIKPRKRFRYQLDPSPRHWRATDHSGVATTSTGKIAMTCGTDSIFAKSTECPGLQAARSRSSVPSSSSAMSQVKLYSVRSTFFTTSPPGSWAGWIYYLMGSRLPDRDEATSDLTGPAINIY
ncbi:hypothetical protein BDV26DRAFT_104387 [Aspergillus bertholletiae]|uniref:Uncharacterized protein n=1 Tax=Aspergillus bertholletiae TaxID=1226010 RepID=A0A5N7AQY9_9EURO|nr:hypothetical protein BDV26DRAFT_104387 [Aspergillus bertholletiae]